MRVRKVLIFGASFAAAGITAIFLALLFSPRPPLLEGVPFGKAVLDSSGKLMKMGLSADDKYRLPAQLDAIPQYAIDALLKYEDQFFYYHPGINVFSICRSFGGLLGLRRKTGASTLTMQVARLKQKLATNTLAGKMRQIWQALLIERHYAKAEILEAYFNLAPYGGNIEGLEAAARIYFDKAAAQLTPLEIQALTVIPQNPVKRNPVSGAQFAAARNRLCYLLDGQSTRGSLPALAIRSPTKLPALGQHLAREQMGSRPGPEIRTYVQRDLQLMLEKALRIFADRGRRYNLDNAAALIIDVENMRVVASCGSCDFFNEEISGQIDGTRIRRSPGSTLKPFIYALALDQGLIHPGTILADSPRSFGGYDPENFDKGFQGPVSAAEALRQSRNLPAIFLAGKLGYPDLYEFLDQAHIGLPQSREYYGLALALGGAEISMRELGSLYAMLLNGGLWQPLKFSSDDETFAPVRLLSPEAAWLTLGMLERPDCVIKNGGASLPCRYKTGTSNGFRDAWTAGTLGNYVIVAWVGNFDNSANPLFIGAETALPLFMQIASGLSSLRPMRDFQQRKLAGLNIAKASVCASTGDFASGQCANTAETFFIPGVSPIRDSGILRPILIDSATGLRACRPNPGRTEETIWEFWPSDLKKTFADAGVFKPDPPEWLPECRIGNKPVISPAPRIVLPKNNVTYYRQLGEKDFSIPLQAAADADAGQIHWYAGNEYIGQSRPGETIFWQPRQAIATEIRAMDESGRTTTIKCRLGVIPNASTR